MYRKYGLYKLVFVLIRVLRPRFPGCDENVCSGSCYRPLKHGLFVVGFSFMDWLLGLLVAVVTVVPGMDPFFVLLLQFLPDPHTDSMAPGADYLAPLFSTLPFRVWQGG